MNLLIQKHIILDYPSASAVEVYNDKIYVIGDDSNKILCLNKQLQIISEIVLFNYFGDRIPKKDKPDFEACTIFNHQLLIFGSGSLLPQRGSLYFYDLNNNEIKNIDICNFYNKIISSTQFRELNIEGLTSIKNTFLFFNRANNSQNNTLIICNNFIEYLTNPEFLIDNIQLNFIDIEISKYKNHILGVSGATYMEDNDTLYLTASAENTDNAYDDGEIMGSVLCIIDNISKKINSTKLIIEQYIELEFFDDRLKNQKIESICCYDENKILLVADNDNGQSELFLLEVEN